MFLDNIIEETKNDVANNPKPYCNGKYAVVSLITIALIPVNIDIQKHCCARINPNPIPAYAKLPQQFAE